MKRVERTRIERLRRGVVLVGLSFAAGALADTALTWRLQHYGAGLFPVHDRSIAATAGDAPAETAPGTTPGAPNVSSTPSSPTPPNDSNRPNVPNIASPPLSPLSPNDPNVSNAPNTPNALSVPAADAVALLRARRLAVPVDGVQRRDLHDSYTDARGERVHEALDILAPRNTAVRAVEDGPVAKLFRSEAGGITLYQYDRSGAFCYYYAHLDHYADGLSEGQMLRRGDVLGYVGNTGNAATGPTHLHFAIFRLTPERQWWKGEPLDPYAVLE
jgi:murein DD-endopeptidase MepM/ murein hydrolase activator NlpD